MIQRYLKKRSIDKNFALVMPVNDRSHWYFAKFQDNNLTVYDSLKKRTEVYQ
jgi:Ulp1 family protease